MMRDSCATVISVGDGMASTSKMRTLDAIVRPPPHGVIAVNLMAKRHTKIADGRVLFANLQAIVIAEAAVQSFFAQPQLARFGPLLKPVRHGDLVAQRLSAVALPGHAPGHTGYAFDTDEDRFLFFGDVVHVPALQFGNPALGWGYDDDQPTARATRLKVFHDAAEAGTWIAGAHLGWPGIGRVVRKGEAYGYEPAA
jgi:glyoxylase-like metal-dependent hydrolase (beta-lactamase superfamily II)